MFILIRDARLLARVYFAVNRPRRINSKCYRHQNSIVVNGLRNEPLTCSKRIVSLLMNKKLREFFFFFQIDTRIDVKYSLIDGPVALNKCLVKYKVNQKFRLKLLQDSVRVNKTSGWELATALLEEALVNQKSCSVNQNLVNFSTEFC